MSNKSKFKIEPKLEISKGSFNPNPEVKVSSQNTYYGIGGEYNLIDEEDTNLKISGNVGKGSGRSVVESSFGEDIFKGEGPIDKNFKITYTKKFYKGGMTKPQKKIQKAYIGRAIRQPTETDTEFEIRHEYHTPFKGPQKAKKGGIAKGCGKVMKDRRKVTKMY